MIWRTWICVLTVATLTATANAGDDSHWPAVKLPTIAALGCEQSGRFVEDNPGWGPHLVTLFTTGKNPDAPWHSAAQHIEWASDPLHSYVADGSGGLVILAHPGDRDFEQIVNLPGLTGFEVSHGGDSAARDKLWNKVLTWRLARGQTPLWGFAGDDTHGTDNIDRSWLAVRLETLTESTLKHALRTGNFYISNGPVITDIQVSGSTVTVTTARPADIRWLKSGQYGIGTPRVGTGGGVGGDGRCLRFDKAVTQSTYTLNTADGTTDPDTAYFIRAIVTTDTPGQAAHTQPLVIRSATTLANPYAASGPWLKGMTHNHVDALEGSEHRIADYYAAYAAKGHTVAFETGYDYWVMPFLYYPPGRVPVIDQVIPDRLPAGAAGKISIIGQSFAANATVLIDGRPVETKNTNDGIIATTPASLTPGPHDVTVRNPAGLQDTRQYALVVQPDPAANIGWTTYTPANSQLGSWHTYALADDYAGGMWIATNYGLNHFDGKRWHLYRPVRDDKNSLLSGTVYDVAVDSDDGVWYTCFTGAGLRKSDGNWIRWRGADVGFDSKQVNQVLRVDSDTYVSLHNRHGLYVYRNDRWQPVNVPVEKAKRAKINGLATGPAGVMWLATTSGLLRWDIAKGDDGWRHFSQANSPLPTDYLRRVIVDGKGGVCIATAAQDGDRAGGMARLAGDSWTVWTPANSPLPERRIWTIFADRDDNLWAGTSKGAACRRADGTWRTYTTTNSGLADNLVTDIAQDTNGNLWLTTARGVSRLAAP